MSSSSRRLRVQRRTVGSILVLTVLAIGSIVGVARASQPVQIGFRDDTVIGGGVNRPNAHKNQSKLWFTDGQWFGGLFKSGSTSAGNDAFRIHRYDVATNDWVTGTTTGAGLPPVDDRNASHGDYLWVESTQTLWVASSTPPDFGPPTTDAIRVYRFDYDAGSNGYTAHGVASIPGTASTADNADGGNGGAVTVSIARGSDGRLYAVWGRGGQVRYSVSTDGATWSAAAQLPAQAGNSINASLIAMTADVASVFSYGDHIGVLWSDHDNNPAPSANSNGFYFTSLAAGADPTVPANWTSAERLPALAGANDGERADNHINVKVAADGTVYAIGKTGKDSADCATNQNLPLITLFKRDTGGTWTVHLVSTVGDCNTRPQLVLSDQLDVVYAVMSSPNGGGTMYLKSAPMNGPEALQFRTANTTLQPGTPIIKSATELLIDDATTTRQSVTGTSGILVLANNVLRNAAPAQTPRYLWNRLSIGGAPDSTDPTGTVTIDGGAASTSDPGRIVSLAVPATDTGSGVSQVRIANTNAVGGNGVLNGAGATTYAYATPKAWALPAGDGTKTVYVQWRDGAGNWSAVASDTIVYDSAPTTGAVSINSAAQYTTSTSVSVGVTATDSAGVSLVRLANSASVDASGILNGVGATTYAYGTPKPWTLPTGDGPKTVYVQWKDGNGIWSPVKSDAIILDRTKPTGTATINGGAAGTTTTAVTVAVPATDGGSGVSHVRIANSSSVDGNGVLNGANATTFAYATPKAWSLPSGDAVKAVYVQWRDAAGNWSTVANDLIRLDTTAPNGTVSINGGAASTPIGSVSVGVAASDASGVAQVRLSNTSTTSGGVLTGGTTFAYASSVSWTLTSGNGSKTVYVQWKDALGHWSTVKSDSIVLSSPDTTLVPVTPVRLLDTRANNPAGIGQFFHATPRSFQITGRGGIPADAVAITGNLTITGQTAAGYVSLGPTMNSAPSTSTINFPKSDTRANGVVVPLSPTGSLAAVYMSGAGQRTHLVLDVTGYFVATTTGARYTPLAPARFLDTRIPRPGDAAMLRDATPYGFRVGGRSISGVTVPSDAVAVTGNLTVTGQTRGGYLALTPNPQAAPTTSTLNFPVGDTRANNVTVRLGSGGFLYVTYRGSGRAHAIFDVTGYFRAGSSGLTYVPLAPARIVDTRTDLGITDALRTNSPKTAAIRARGGVALDAQAFTGNVTVVSPTEAGYLSTTPTPVANPTTSTINFPRKEVRANGVAGKIDPATGRSAFVYKAGPGSATTNLVVDVTGYFH
jgi:hypothetical protein